MFIQNFVKLNLHNLPYRKCRDTVRQYGSQGAIEKVKFSDCMGSTYVLECCQAGWHHQNWCRLQPMINKITKLDVYSLFMIDKY